MIPNLVASQEIVNLRLSNSLHGPVMVTAFSFSASGSAVDEAVDGTVPDDSDQLDQRPGLLVDRWTWHVELDFSKPSELKRWMNIH